MPLQQNSLQSLQHAVVGAPQFEIRIFPLQGTAWDFESPSREAFFPKLRSAMDLVHAAGIMHNPRVTHGSNILIAPDKHVFVLDFAEALLNPTDKALKEEMTRIGYGQP